MHWILSPEPNEDPVPVPLVEDLIMSEDFLAAENRPTFLQEKMALTPDMTEQAAKLTTGQRENPKWSSIRKMRLTASNFGVILHSLRTKKFRILTAFREHLSAQYGA